MRWLLIVAVLAVAAVAATLVRYGSVSPCRWLVVDTAAQSGLPETLAAARARADMALRGVVEPDAGDCLLAWWRVRRDGVRANGNQG